MRTSRMIILSLALSSNLFAQDIKVVGTLHQTLRSPQIESTTEKPVPQKIKLLKMQLSAKAIQTLNQRTEHATNPTNIANTTSNLPHKIQLGMDNVAVLDRVDTDKTINQIKVALGQGDRVTFAALLLDFNLGVMGAVGTHHAKFDAWVLTPEIARDISANPQFGGHEMVITGYDDEAVATDEQGVQHKGLFTLRNTWGDKAGDHGNFYMSYDYFKVLVYEAHRIHTLPSMNENANIATA